MSKSPIIRQISRRYSATALEQQHKFFKQIGDREIVGFGVSGYPAYYDSRVYPYPSIRFGNPTKEVHVFLIYIY